MEKEKAVKQGGQGKIRKQKEVVCADAELEWRFCWRQTLVPFLSA